MGKKIAPPKRLELPSDILEKVIEDMVRREKRGFEKYNTTMDRQDLSLVEWLNHAYEETLDKALYLKKSIDMMTREGHYTGYTDSDGKPIHVGDVLEIWLPDNVHENKGIWVDCKIVFRNNRYAVMEEGFNYTKSREEDILSIQDFTGYKMFIQKTTKLNPK